MFREYFILLLLGHILGDFYIQTGKVAERKEKSLKWVFIHCAYYFAVIIFVSLGIISWEIILVTAMASVFHLVIDLIKYRYISSINKQGKMTQIKERNIFIIDQILHFLSLTALAYLAVKNNIQLREPGIIADFLSTIGLSRDLILSWALAVLIIHKPANIIISKLLMIYKPESKASGTSTDKNAGRFIGTVERFIMLIFLSIGQYAAIGLVLTAKSIARYDKISKEPEFAEYYLLGTLLSTVLVLVVSVLL